MADPTPLDLDTIRAHANAATPGPWTADTTTRGDCVVWGPNGRFIANTQAEPHWVPDPDGRKRSVVFDVDRCDSEFIAAARELVPAMADEIERLRAEVAGARRQVADEIATALDRNAAEYPADSATADTYRDAAREAREIGDQP